MEISLVSFFIGVLIGFLCGVLLVLFLALGRAAVMRDNQIKNHGGLH